MSSEPRLVLRAPSPRCRRFSEVLKARTTSARFLEGKRNDIVILFPNLKEVKVAVDGGALSG